MMRKLLLGLFLIAVLTLCACGKVENISDTSFPTPSSIQEQNKGSAGSEASITLQTPSSSDEKSNTPDTGEAPEDENTIVAQIGDNTLTPLSLRIIPLHRH